MDIDHGPVLTDFIDWCKLSFLDINVLKTKEMTIDFRKNPLVISLQWLLMITLLRLYINLNTLVL